MKKEEGQESFLVILHEWHRHSVGLGLLVQGLIRHPTFKIRAATSGETPLQSADYGMRQPGSPCPDKSLHRPKNMLLSCAEGRCINPHFVL